MKKKVYLAGCIGEYYRNGSKSYPEEWRKEAIRFFEKYSTDFSCCNPMDYYKYDCDYHQTEFEVMRFDLRKVKEADIILVNIKDLDKSLGTSDEILYAYLDGKPIIGFYQTNSETEEIYVHPWKNEQIDRIEIGETALDDAVKYIVGYYG